MNDKKEKYRYGNYTAEVSPANGVKGVIIHSFGDEFYFRVYHSPGHDNFTDYLIRHDDLSVTIDAKEMAAFYQIGDDYILDHSPQVLGLKKVE